MKNRKKLFVLSTLMLLSTLCVVSCDKTPKESNTSTKVENSDSSGSGQTKNEIWSIYSTVKVLQNQKEDLNYKKLDAKIDLLMMQDEKEGHQLIITPSKDVQEFFLETCDLKDEENNVISKDQISVYHERYTTIHGRTDVLNKDFALGDQAPDLLLPQNISKEFKENTIKANENGGIYVEIKSTKETIPGIYTGEFTLKVDDEETKIPVRVEVIDAYYDKTYDFMSSFLLYANSLLKGEYEVSEELIAKYHEFFLDYNVNLYTIQQSSDVNKIVEYAKENYDNLNFNSICIPTGMEQNYTSTCGSADTIVNYIKEFVKNSTKEKPIIDYLYLYASNYDEIDAYPDKYNDFINVFKEDGEWKKTLTRAINEVKALAEFKAFDKEFQDYIISTINNFQAVIPITSAVSNDWVEGLTCTFCPQISVFNDQSYYERLVRHAEKYTNNSLWTYTCVGPTYPFPTFHIDDYNLGSRVSGWIEKKYNISGYLYWAVNVYEAINKETWRDIDPYKTGERSGDNAGDGFLCYPGKYYNSEYPFPSIRLVAYRDSMEDYKMLSYFESLIAELSTDYGVSIDCDKILENLYDNLFHGTIYYTNDELVYNAKKELANLISAAKSESKLVYVDNKDSITVYSKESSLKINNTTVNGEAAGKGFKYEIKDMDQVNITTNSTSVNTICPKINKINVSKVNVNEKSSMTEATGTYNFVIKSEEKEDSGATMRFKPYVEFKVNDLSNMKALDFTVNASGVKDIEGYVNLKLKSGQVVKIGSFLAYNGEKNVRVLLDKEKYDDAFLQKVDSIRITFDNLDSSNNLYYDREFSLSDMYMEVN